MSRWKLKACPRCGGDLFIYKDEYGWKESCLQCGFIRDLNEVQKEEKKEPCQVK